MKRDVEQMDDLWTTDLEKKIQDLEVIRKTPNFVVCYDLKLTSKQKYNSFVYISMNGNFPSTPIFQKANVIYITVYI